MGRHLLGLLDAVAADPGRRLSALPLLPDDERRVPTGWSDTRAERPRAPVHRLILEQARRTPAAPAAVFPDAELSYGELDLRSAAVARRLRARDVGPDSRVALLAGRTPGMLAGVLGILRAGGAYVPLDPAAPAERIAFVLRDSGARVLLAEPALLDRAPGFDGVVLPLGGDDPPPEDDPGPEPEVPPEALAYVIYTSGSTGTPKGVMVPHRALANLAHAEVELHGFGASTRLFSTVPLSFDASAGDVFPMLLCGGTLVIHPAPGELSAAEMLAFVRRHAADAATVAVALWSPWLDQLEAGWDGAPLPLPGVTRVGGESLPLERARAWLRLGGGRARLFNHYGPTETTVIVTAREAGAAERDTVSGSVPIGRPLPGTAVYVLDRHLRAMAVGAVGEMFVGGAQVARGYLGRPELTAATFLPDPFAPEPGARMYRTGDRGRRLPDGALEFLGRVDGQVKIRGFRVETAEVEAAILAHPDVREAAVAVDRGPGGEQRLAGYFVAAGDAADASALRDHLRARLPEYMVPAALVRLDALPLTSNGKVDRRALPAPADAGSASYVAPRTAAEEALAAVWAEVLGVERVGVRDDFFELGGHSLSAARLVARVRERLGRELTLAELFRGATIERLARGPRRRRAGRPSPVPAAPARRGRGAVLLRPRRRGGWPSPTCASPAAWTTGRSTGCRRAAWLPARRRTAASRRWPPATWRPCGPRSRAGRTCWADGPSAGPSPGRWRSGCAPGARRWRSWRWWTAGPRSREPAPPLPDDADLLALLAADLGVSAGPGTLASLQDELRALPPDARLTRFAGWIRRLEPDLHDLDDAGLSRRLDVYRAAARAAAAYRARPYAGPVTLFRAGRSAAWPGGDLSAEAWAGDPRLRWRELTAGPLDVRQVPGTHHSIVVGEDVDGLAAALRSALGAVAPA
nr:hybrid non-ribosomal peptide synthetase/type I polyketide synthase [uncultured bacterium]